MEFAQGQLLAQVKPGVTTPVVLYAAGELATEITLIKIPALVGTPNVKIYHDDDGTTFDDTTIICNVQLAVNDNDILFQAQTPGAGITIKPGGSLAIAVDVADSVNASVYGATAQIADRVRGYGNGRY